MNAQRKKSEKSILFRIFRCFFARCLYSHIIDVNYALGIEITAFIVVRYQHQQCVIIIIRNASWRDREVEIVLLVSFHVDLIRSQKKNIHTKIEWNFGEHSTTHATHLEATTKYSSSIRTSRVHWNVFENRIFMPLLFMNE